MRLEAAVSFHSFQVSLKLSKQLDEYVDVKFQVNCNMSCVGGDDSFALLYTLDMRALSNIIMVSGSLNMSEACESEKFALHVVTLACRPD